MDLINTWKFKYLEDIQRLVCSDGTIYNLKGVKLALKPSFNKYLRCRVYSKGKESYRWVHRLVAECFIGPVKLLHVHHKDLDVTHNWDTNLEIKSPENHRKWHKRERVKITPKKNWSMYRFNMKTKEEEYVDNMYKEFPYIAAYFGDAQSYVFLCKTLADYGKLMYNQAIDEAANNAYADYTFIGDKEEYEPQEDEIEIYVIKDSILKLKK